MTCLFNHLRGKVSIRAAERLGSMLRVVYIFLRKTEVSKEGVALFVEYDVVGFQVSIYDVCLV